MAKAKVRLVEDGGELFVERNGKRIAKRGIGRYAKQWISLEPGFIVYGDSYLVIEQHGAALHKSELCDSGDWKVGGGIDALDEFVAEKGVLMRLKITATDYRMTRRNIFIGAAASLICAPALVRAASLMPVRGLPLQFLNPERRIPKTVGEWYQQCFYNNLDNDLRAGRAMTYGPISGKTVSVAEGYRIVAQARAEEWLPPHRPTI